MTATSADTIKFFTWNIKGSLEDSFYFALNAHLINQKVDILILQEDGKASERNMPGFQEVKFAKLDANRRWVRIFLNVRTGLYPNQPTPFINNKLRAVEIKTLKGKLFNLAGVHLYSEVGISKDHQKRKSDKIIAAIKSFEELTRHDKTLIVGDLNFRPHDIELMDPMFFNAVPNKYLIRNRKSRIYLDQSYPYFYNPMWNLLGDYDYLLNLNNS